MKDKTKNATHVSVVKLVQHQLLALRILHHKKREA